MRGADRNGSCVSVSADWSYGGVVVGTGVNASLFGSGLRTIDVRRPFGLAAPPRAVISSTAIRSRAVGLDGSGCTQTVWLWRELPNTFTSSTSSAGVNENWLNDPSSP